jgi:2-methylcitrate dehydratase PrpD
MTAARSMIGDGITKTIAEFVTALAFEEIPGSVITSAKLFTLECIGHMVHASPLPVSRLIVGMVREHAAEGPAVVVGAGFRTAAAEAAYANGSLAHADELEACGTLPGTGLIPPIAAGLAVGEAATPTTGAEFLASLVAGIELQGRIGTAAIGACDRGFMGFSFVGPAAACVTSGKLLGLDSQQMCNALGVALPLGGGSLRGDGYMSHVHEAGVPARTGVWAAQLASRGFTASPDYLDGPFSWGEQYVGQSNRPYDADVITKHLGESFFLTVSDVATKLYGTSGVTHQAIEGTIRLMRDNDLRPEAIGTVELLVPPFAVRIASFPEPVGGEQAKFSFEQAVAGLLVDGIPRLPYTHAFTDEATWDPRYQDARRRVHIRVDQSRPNVRGFDSQTITLNLRDGRRLSTVVDRLDVAGRVNNPLTVDERISVFLNTVESLGRDRANRLADTVMDLEHHFVQEVTRLVATP